MAKKRQPQTKQPQAQWTDPYTQQQWVDPKIVKKLKKQLEETPADLTPLAGACLVELYKGQFSITPTISYTNQPSPDGNYTLFKLTPAKGAVGGFKAWNSMATALDGLNRKSSSFEEGNDLLLVTPPAHKDGKITIAVSNIQELVQVIKVQRKDIYDRADLSLQSGVNYAAGAKGKS